MSLETASANVRTMGESVKAAAVPSKQTEVCVEAEVIYEGSSGAPELLPKKTLILLKIWMQNQVIILN